MGTLLVRAPCNLGLRPLWPGHEPGTWRAPAALSDAGLVEAIAPAGIVDLARPSYDPAPQPGTQIRNGAALRAFNLQLADAIAAASDFPIVLGGDCSVLVGALAGARRKHPVALVHVDGHSDFRHPGNAESAPPFAAAGMDLALATGRGEPLLTTWPGVPAPLVPDHRVIQIGDRETGKPDFPWRDIKLTAITRIDVFAARAMGAAAILTTVATVLDQNTPVWVHFDVDALDQAVLPAVDTPGSPGIDPETLVALLRGLMAKAKCAGMTVTIYDPDLDPSGAGARLLVGMLSRVFAP